jgi:hypothetical protein
MIQNLNLLIAGIIGIMSTTTMVSLVLLLPAAIELRKPKDNGPRMITQNFETAESNTPRIVLRRIEEELKPSNFCDTAKVGNVIEFLPNLEV